MTLNQGVQGSSPWWCTKNHRKVYDPNQGYTLLSFTMCFLLTKPDFRHTN